MMGLFSLWAWVMHGWAWEAGVEAECKHRMLPVTIARAVRLLIGR